MSYRSRIFHIWAEKKRFHLSPTQIIALAFAGIILVGTLLLNLPAASRSGESCGFRPALFTATSATCVTGLVLYDTYTQWSAFGQIVILCLIELGGLGFMTAASFVIFILRRKIGLRQRMVMAQTLSVNEIEGVVRLQKCVLFGSAGIQILGAAILFFRFLPDYGARTALHWGVFHAVSAFCNAGFDLFGVLAPGQSVIPFNSDPVVCITLMALIVVGGLGFFVWDEAIRVRRFRKFSVYTKLVLITTGGLILAGAAAFCALEWNNPATLGQMSVSDKLLNGFFQSVTCRTAGFASIDQGAMTDGSKAVSILLMLIGGSSGSTAGGVKTVTFVVLLLFLAARMRGRSRVCAFRRTIPGEKVMDAMTIVTLVVLLAVGGAVYLCVTSPFSLTDALYETASAIATVGLTSGGTPLLSVGAQILIIIYMYFGRVGVLTISLGFLMGNRAEERYQYASTSLLIG